MAGKFRDRLRHFWRYKVPHGRMFYIRLMAQQMPSDEALHEAYPHIKERWES